MCDKIEVTAVLYALEKINGKWKIPILLNLRLKGEMRFNELQKTIDGIGSKMLSKELKELEEKGLILRNVSVSTPIRITYNISKYGRTLDTVLFALSNWGQMHIVETTNEHTINHQHIIDI